VRFHTASVSVPSEDKISKVIGNKLDVAVGLGANSVYLAVGTDSLNMCKSLIDKSKAETSKQLPPFQVNVALLPIGPGNFSVSEAAQLASDIGAAWLIPMHHATFIDDARTTEPDGPVQADEDREADFVTHMLGHRPAQKFKVLKCGEKWTVPEE